ncbi:uncharacterized protein LOC106645718 [Copidosoma floridanum]|uniref:uncharacterized protein LOC106645718 n=1 Tax=Copidosoma floridanum TaxID=29053 RepID=UPI0006C94C68|nr:uncharacterized protein LOC106645718 [Copidosoma floridanum]
MTIPRLELRAALLAAKLLQLTSTELDAPIENCRAWTDSQIVLRWLRSVEPTGNALVDNYVAHIQELLPSNIWRYVPTSSNPADVASRGADAGQLHLQSSWWHGPAWLSNGPECWPHEDLVTQPSMPVTCCVVQRPEAHLLDRFSDLSTLLRVLARLHRWVRAHLGWTRDRPVTPFLTAIELRDASLACVRLSQERAFARKLSLLRLRRPLPKNHPLASVAAFIHTDGVLRVGGRIQHSALTYDEQHPPIIHGSCNLSRLVLSWAHSRALHGGFRVTSAYVARRAWIIGGRAPQAGWRSLCCPFLAALTRFSGRRGRPSELWSDNATCFRRADHELRKALQQVELEGELIAGTLVNQGIDWRFIPPGAPHFGGLWEAGVKSVKGHLRRVIGSRHLTYEELSTVLVSIEMVLNSRPLVPLSGEADDLEVLTPGHLITGAPLNSIIEALPAERCPDRLAHWELVHSLPAQFWTRWSREYLYTLQQRPKWATPRRNFAVGDVVAVLDPTLLFMVGRWPLGRILRVHLGHDGLVRAAIIRASTGEYLRPVNKLALLPVETTSGRPLSPVLSAPDDAQNIHVDATVLVVQKLEDSSPPKVKLKSETSKRKW